MRKTRWAIPAATAPIVLLAFVGPVLAQMEQKPAKTPVLIGPKSTSGWYTAAEFEHAVQAAETLGRPMALMYQSNKSTCPKHNGQRDAWLRARELTAFVRVIVDTRDPTQPQLLKKFRQEAGDRAGRFIPMLFLGTRSGKLLGAVPYNTPRPQFLAIVGGTFKSFGGVLPFKKAIELWDKLEKARTHWGSGKLDPALKCYRDIKRLEGTNPKLSIFAELRKDEEQINQKGAEEVAAVKAFYQQGKKREARTAVAEICRRYAGFKPAEDAKGLRSTAERQSAGRTPPPSTPASEELASRTWSDNTGKHRIEAELVAVKAGWVRLKKASGDYVNVPIRRLGRADQDYVRRWVARRGDDGAKDGRKEAPP